MVAYLSKFDASEGFNKIIDFLNVSSIKYALIVNPNIYVSCIKQFWTTVAVKKVNDVTRLQALVDKKKVVVTKAMIQGALCLDDAEGVECLPNEEIFAELARMGYEKPSIKLTFYKAFLSGQCKFLIHTILQCMSAKRTSWNEFSSSMASTVICLSSVPTADKEPSIPSPTPPTPPPQPSQDIPSTSQVQPTPPQGRMIADMNADANVVLEEAKDLPADIAKADQDAKVLSMHEDEYEPTEVQEVVEVVTTTKLITEVVTAASTTLTTAEVTVPAATTAAAPTLTAAPRRRTKGLVIRDPKEALKRINKTPAEKVAKRKKLDEEVQELKRHLQIVPNEDDDVYTEATPLARKVPVVGYEIINQNNKPYYKIIRADGTHQLYISFLTLLRNFDKEDLEAL
nr:hypothetical protein [Tanacetum cinerariifolium]